tara:strand:+ start:69 stop:317 length:249 start_codon:yes stop_codon:yes gene_type:complete
MSDYTEENQSVTYDVIVSGSSYFLQKVKRKFKDVDYGDIFEGRLEYCSPCDLQEAEELMEGIKKIAKDIIEMWDYEFVENWG